MVSQEQTLKNNLHNANLNCAVCRGFSKHFVIPPFLCSKLMFYVSKRLKAFSCAKDMKKSVGGLQRAVSLPVGPRQSSGGGTRGETPGNSAYLGFENLLL